MNTKNIEFLSNYNISDLLDEESLKTNISKINIENIPTESSVENKIRKMVIFPSYFLGCIGIIAVLFFCVFISLYCSHYSKEIWLPFLILLIVLGIIFFIGYFFINFLYSYNMKKQFRRLKIKFNNLRDMSILIKYKKSYPESLQVIDYENEPTAWTSIGKNIPKFSYYVCTISLIIFFNKLKTFLLEVNKNE